MKFYPLEEAQTQRFYPIDPANDSGVVALRADEPTEAELAVAGRPALINPFIARQGERAREIRVAPPVIPVPPLQQTVPQQPVPQQTATPYKNRREALDDAVNLLEENQDFNLVAKAFANIGITPDQIAAHGKARNSAYFAPQQTIPEPNVRGSYLGPATISSTDIKPEDQSILRQVPDYPLNLAQGAIAGIRMIAEAIPANQAGTAVSNNLRAVEKYLGSLMSAQAREDGEEISRIMQDAEGQGVADQVKSGIKALSVAPVKTIINALGTSAPVILAGLAAFVAGAPVAVSTGVGLGIGALSGAGTIKGTIYDETKQALISAGVNKFDAEERAKLAQQYNGKNLDQILLGAAIGAGANITGIQPALAKTLAAKILGKVGAAETTQAAASKTIEAAATEITKRSYGQIAKELTKAGLIEGTPEFFQAFQEKVAGNIAQQKEGFDVKTFSGAVAAGTLEGLAGLGLGAGVKGVGIRADIKEANLTPSERFARELAKGVRLTNFSPEAQEQNAIDRLRLDPQRISPQETRARGAAADELLRQQGFQPRVPPQDAANVTGVPTPPPAPPPAPVPPPRVEDETAGDKAVIPGLIGADQFAAPDLSVTPVTLKEDSALPEFPTQEDKLKYYFANNKNVKQEDIVTFDDAILFKQPDGSYADVPDASRQDADITYSSIDEIKDSIENNFSGATFNDYLLKPERFFALIAKMLDWDKPLSQQPEVVNALRQNTSIDIPLGKGKAVQPVPRFWYHNPRGRGFDTEGEIASYDLGKAGTEFSGMFREPPKGFVYLSPTPIGRDAVMVDITKLDPSKMRLTGQSEGFAVYGDSIPRTAYATSGNDFYGLISNGGKEPTEVKPTSQRTADAQTTETVTPEKKPEAPSVSVAEGKARIAAAVTGQPFTATLLRGQGRESSPYNQLGAQVPILGQGNYTTNDRNFAKEFGTNITEHVVSLQNPLVISNDKEWRALTKNAGWPYPNPFGQAPEKTESDIATLRAKLVDSGYDGVIVQVPTSEVTGKTLQNLFGSDQVLEFNVAKPVPAKAEKQAAPVAAAPVAPAAPAPRKAADVPKATESIQDQGDLAPYIQRFNAGDFAVPKYVTGTGTEGIRIAEAQNKQTSQDYARAVKLFLEEPITAKPPTQKQTKLNSEFLQDISPQPIPKKIVAKTPTTFDAQRKALNAVAARNNIRLYLNGTHIDTKNNIMVVTDGNRMAVFKNANLKGMPAPIEGTTVLGYDGKWVPDTKFPDYARVIPKENRSEKFTVDAVAMGDYARGVAKANKFFGSTFPGMPITDGNVTSRFNASYIADMTDVFRRFGYETFNLELGGTVGDTVAEALLAISPDGKLTQVVMSMRGASNEFAPFDISGGKKAAKPVKKAAKQPSKKQPAAIDTKEKPDDLSPAFSALTTLTNLLSPKKPAPSTPAGESTETMAMPGVNVSRIGAMFGAKLYGKPDNIAAVSVKELVQNSFDAIKEALEKKQITQGSIQIRIDDTNRTITVTDNGPGMPGSVMGKEFLELAGTVKGTDRPSGGLGVAKMLFVYENEKLEVVSLREGVVSRLETTGAELKAALAANPASLLEQLKPFLSPEQLELMIPMIQESVKRLEASGVVIPKITVQRNTDKATVDFYNNLFPSGNGTSVKVTVPQSYIDQSDGKTIQIPFKNYTLKDLTVLKKSPLFDNIEVSVTDSYNTNVLPIGKNFPIDKYTTFANVKFNWGVAKIYVTKDKKPSGWSNTHILSNGLWQFDGDITESPGGGKSINREFYIDVVPNKNVRPEDPGYPFELNRQKFAPAIAPDFAAIFKYISTIYKQIDFRGEVKSFGTVQYINDDGTLTTPKELKPTAPPKDNAFTLISPGDTVEVRDGAIFINNRQVPELTQEQIKSASIDYAQLTIPQDEIDPNKVMVHDNTVTKDRVFTGQLAEEKNLFVLDKLVNKYPDLYEITLIPNAVNPDVKEYTFSSKDFAFTSTEGFPSNIVNALQSERRFKKVKENINEFLPPGQSLSDAARAEFGDRYDNYLSTIGNVFYNLRRGLVDIDPTKYAGLDKEAIGISIDKGYYGVSILVPFRGMFINPASTELRDTPAQIATFMITVMIHELAHFKVRSHKSEDDGAGFASEMQRIQVLLRTDKKSGGLLKVEDDLTNFVDANLDIFNYLNKEFRGESYIPSGDVFTDASANKTPDEGRSVRIKGAGDEGGGRSIRGRPGERAGPAGQELQRAAIDTEASVAKSVDPVTSKALNEADQLPGANKKLPPGRSPELTAAAALVKSGEMTAAEFDKLVNKYQPIYLFKEPQVPATTGKMAGALNATQREKIDPPISAGIQVGLRLDIPAFRKGVAVVSIHSKGTKSGPGKIIGYSNVASVTNATFGIGNQRASLEIAAGAGKDALHTIEGKYVSITPEQAYTQARSAIFNPAWTQIGLDPTRHSYFYDRRSTIPVIAAEEILQIGNMVLGKNVTYGDKDTFLYNIIPQPAASKLPTVAKANQKAWFYKDLLPASGFNRLPIDSQRTYKDKSGQSFLTFERDGVRVAFSSGQKLYSDKRGVGVYQGDTNESVFHALIVDPQERKKGKATNALIDIIRSADESNTNIYLQPASLDAGAMTTSQLVEFYKRFGFEPQNNDKVLIRVANLEKQSPKINNLEPRIRPPQVDSAANQEIRAQKLEEYRQLRQKSAALQKKIRDYGGTLETQQLSNILSDVAGGLKSQLVNLSDPSTTPENFLNQARKAFDGDQPFKEKQISAAVFAVIQTAYQKTPWLLNGLRLSVKKSESKTAGAAAGFNPFARVVALWTGTSGVTDPTSVRHEFAHSMEQMMTPDQRRVVVDEWMKSLDDQIKNNKDPLAQEYFAKVLEFLTNPSKKTLQAATDALPSTELYQYLTPSEYWAVNAEPLLGKQLGGQWAKFVKAISRLFEGLKHVLGFNNKYAVHKVFNDLINGPHERVTKMVLFDIVKTSGYTFQMLENIQDAENLTAGRPNTPFTSYTPIRDTLIKAPAAGKEIFKRVLRNPLDTLDRVQIAARNKAVWFGTGIDAYDFANYKGGFRTASGLATASVALDNAIRGGMMAVQVIMLGGIQYDQRHLQFRAVKRSKGMVNVYKAEAKLRKQLGNQLGTNLIQGYLEAKRSFSIKEELEARENEVDRLADDLANLPVGTAPKVEEALREEHESAVEGLKAISMVENKINLSDQQIADFIDSENRYPELRVIMDNWTAANQNMLGFWKQVGLLSQSRYDMLAGIKDYVPWHRIMEDDVSPAMSRENNSIGSSARSYTNIGRERLFKSGKPTITTRIVVKSGQQDFKLPPFSQISGTVSKAGQVTAIRPTDIITDANGNVTITSSLVEGDIVVFKTSREIDNIINNMTQSLQRMTMNGLRQYAAGRMVSEHATRDDTKNILVFPKVDRERGHFNYVHDGRNVVVEIEDKLLADGIYGMDSMHLVGIKYLMGASNLLRRTITLSPYFQFKQVFKDMPTAAVATAVKHPELLMAGVIKSLVTSLLRPGVKAAGKLVGKDIDIEPVIGVLRSFAIGGFFSPNRTPEAAIKMQQGIMNRNVVSFVLAGLDFIGDSSDMAQRAAVYTRVLKETGDEAQALYQAANVINFLHHGSNPVAQFLVRTSPFLGAWSNSIDVLLQALAGGGLKGKTRWKSFQKLAITLSALAATTLVYCILVKGDPDYEEEDDDVKAKNYIIPGTRIHLPMNTSAAWIFKSAVQLTYDYWVRTVTASPADATRLFSALGRTFRDQMFASVPIPTGVEPVVEILLDHDFFTGRSVVSQGLKNVQASEQYTGDTSEIAKRLSSITQLRVLGSGLSYVSNLDKDTRLLNPIEVDHLIKGLFGSVGATVQWLSNLAASDLRPEPTARSNPFTGAFLLPEVPSGNLRLFYDLKQRVDKATKTLNVLLESDKEDEAEDFEYKNQDLLELEKYVNETSKKLQEVDKDIRRSSKSIDPTDTPKSRREDITDFQREKNEIVDGVKEAREDAGL